MTLPSVSLFVRRVIWEHWEINQIDVGEKPPQDGLALAWVVVQLVVPKLS